MLQPKGDKSLPHKLASCSSNTCALFCREKKCSASCVLEREKSTFFLFSVEPKNSKSQENKEEDLGSDEFHAAPTQFQFTSEKDGWIDDEVL